MIVLWGSPADGPLAAVGEALRRSGVAPFVLDQRLALETSVELRVGSTVEGCVRVSGGRFDLGTVRAAYLRPDDGLRLPAVRRAGRGSEAWRHVARVGAALHCWADLTPARVVNRPQAMAANGSKPYQAAQIEALGFRTPATLVTTDPAAVVEFWERHGTLVYKSISGVRSVVRRLSASHRTYLDDVRWCPTQLQEYVPGRDYRVHVVGEEIFAAEVTSDADDYRYPARFGATTEIRTATLPAVIADRCRALAAGLGLPVAGVDLRQTPDGAWFCFEVNPSPGFTYYQEATGQPIDGAIARLLVGDAAGHSVEPGRPSNGLARANRSAARRGSAGSASRARREAEV